MKTRNQYLAALAVAIVAMTSYAQASPLGHYDAKGHFIVTAARAAAIHECSVRAAQYPEYLWGNMEIYQYRACMTEHGQPE